MLLDNFELKIENKTKIFLKNCINNVVSDLWKNGLMCPKNSLDKKVRFHVSKFYVFLLFSTFLQPILLHTWDHISKTVFPELLFFGINLKLKTVRKHA